MEKVELQEAVRRNLQWFEESGVMEPPDGSWGVAERLSVAEGEALEKMKRAFPAWTTLSQGLVIEQRRADCNFEAALLYKLAGEVLDDPECGAVAGKLLDFLYFRSGLLNRYDEGFPAGGWRWSHIQGVRPSGSTTTHGAFSSSWRWRSSIRRSTPGMN